MCVCVCFGKEQYRNMDIHLFKNVTHFKNLRATVSYGNCVDEQIKIRLNLGQVRHSVHNFPICSIIDKTPTHAIFTQHYISLAC